MASPTAAPGSSPNGSTPQSSSQNTSASSRRISGNTLTTSYTYNWMNQVTLVSMQRPTVSYSGTTCSEPGGSTTQTRTFVYDSSGRLTSATNPENATVSYTYNSTNTLNKKTDAKGQATVYTYDSLNRVTEVQRYPQGTGGSEDVCQRVTYTYDTNPVNQSFSQYATGRLTTVQYYGQNPASGGTGCGANPNYNDYAWDSYTEMYSYLPAGAVTAKNLSIKRTNPSYRSNSYGTGSASVEVDYTYDSAGRQSTVTYPMTFQNNSGQQPVLTMGYDAMGRPSSLTDLTGDAASNSAPTNWVSGVQYDYASRLTNIFWTPGTCTETGDCGEQICYQGNCYYGQRETRSYNVNGQLATIDWPSYDQLDQQIQYAYSGTQNNGQITQEVDTGYGGSTQTTAYNYDLLKRLTSSAATGSATWTQTFQYDGFGNLTAKVLNGAKTAIAVNATTNQLTHAYYDANGNMTSGAGATLTYDEANRVTTATENSGGIEVYGYDASNKRIYRRNIDTWEYVTLYGARGENLGAYEINSASCGAGSSLCLTPQGTNIWFNGRMVMQELNGRAPGVYQDRLGTNREYGSGYPYGEGAAGSDEVQFATYTRSSYTGLDYADQRFYASTYGRFLTADPAGSGAVKSGDPVTWNRYAYVGGDPVNRMDPRGTSWVIDDNGEWCSTLDPSGDCYDPGYDDSDSDGGWNSCPTPSPGLLAILQGSPDAPTFEAQLDAMGCYGNAQTPVVPPVVGGNAGTVGNNFGNGGNNFGNGGGYWAYAGCFIPSVITQISSGSLPYPAMVTLIALLKKGTPNPLSTAATFGFTTFVILLEYEQNASMYCAETTGYVPFILRLQGYRPPPPGSTGPQFGTWTGSKYPITDPPRFPTDVE